ncbi:MAG: metallophosphoesterase, partial [Acidobacteriota bacterium]|nr:metallophosphoesterase [Acidobacteriota bacterium]
MRLATFVHISDLHFSNQAHDAKVSKIYALFPKLDGFLGHSYKSLMHLEPFFDNLKITEQARLIVSGDLTRVGDSHEFKAADDYLGDELAPPLGGHIGLEEKDWLELTAPGNHDRYPGIPFLWGGPTTTFSTLFPGMPKVVDIPLASSRGHTLKFIFVDTDADVTGWSRKRGKAEGSFTTQLRALRGMLPGTPGELEIRVMCLHHSRAQRGGFLRMDGASRQELDDLIVSHEVRVLLTGHIHDPPLVELSLATGPSGVMKYLEARCGTTTQRNLFHLPYYWRHLPGFKTAKPRWSNSLLVHRLLEENGKIWWEVELALETP